MISTAARFEAEPGLLGDVVLGRRDAPASYHLAVTLDDHLQGVSLVTRGEDLLRPPISIACCRPCSTWTRPPIATIGC